MAKQKQYHGMAILPLIGQMFNVNVKIRIQNIYKTAHEEDYYSHCWYYNYWNHTKTM